MIQPWNSLALPARTAFALESIRASGAREILDIGCGNGEHLTLPIARACPECIILGFDDHAPTIEAAASQAQETANLTYASELPPETTYDLIIASEVLEHVDEPHLFLDLLHARLRPEGRLLLTVPNGCGSFELLGIIDNLLEMTGIFPLLRRLKRGSSGDGPSTGEYSSAVSPHVNFFSMGSLRALLADRGFTIRQYEGRMFLFDFISMRILDRLPALARLNARLGQKLPAPLVSDWMFVCERQAEPPRKLSEWKRGPYSRFKRWLNRKRWKLDR